MEYWDIYDENKQPTGRTMKRNDWHMAPGDFHLTVLGAVRRADGRILITRRKLDKEWAPGAWEIPGGGVRAGETSYDAILREIREETGLDVSAAPYRLALTYQRVNPQEQNNYFVDVYVFDQDFFDFDVTVQADEVEGFMAASIAEIDELGRMDQFMHYTSIKSVFEACRRQDDDHRRRVLQALTSPKGSAGCDLHIPDDLQTRARSLCARYNRTGPEDEEERRQILVDLFGQGADKVIIEPDFRCDYGFNIHFHGFAFLNYNVSILDTAPVEIGAGVFVAPGAVLSCAGHAIDSSQRVHGIGLNRPVTIGDNVWIGANVTVCPGVTIGRDSVIGAGSVVTRDIPAGVVAFGNPCRVVRQVTEADRIPKEDILF